MSGKMKTISTDQIKERLSQAFTEVKNFTPFESAILSATSVTSRTFSVINFMGLQLIVGVYSTNTEAEIEKDDDNVKWNRYVILAGMNKAYYF